MKRIAMILAGGLLMTPLMAVGAVSDEAFEQLRAELAALSTKLDSLAAENAELRQSQSTTEAAVADVQESVVATHETIKAESEPTWADRIGIKGDFRYRYQHDEVDRSGSDNRNRDRIRARAEITAKLPGNVKTGLGFATGGDDPVSSNQTLGEAGSSKDVKLDLAYFDWAAFENTSARGGKFKNTFEVVGKSQLQWDGDWRPEGFDATWDNETFFAQGLGTYLESDDRKEEEWSYFVQAGWRGQLAGIDLVAGAGYTDIESAGKECFYDGSSPGESCGGNAVDANGRYRFDHQVVNAFGSAGFEIAELPVSLWADWIKNGDADDEDTGYQIGAQVGKAKGKGSWQFKYYYQDLEADATLGLLANSDFGGGGTDAKGSVFQGAYALTDQSTVNLSYYLVEKQDSYGLVNGGEEFDVNTLQMDVNFKYK